MPHINLTIDKKTFPVLSKLAKLLSQKDIDAYLVGGYIRDSLLGKQTRDVDIAVKADASILAKQIAQHFQGKFVLLDDVNKVARVVLPELYLDFSSIQGDINADLLRRDFTVNAMAVDLSQALDKPSIIDPYGGQSDIESKTIRAVTQGAFTDDPARLLRSIRHTAQLRFTIDEKTRAIIKRDAELITNVPGERVFDELCAAIAAPDAAETIRLMDDLGLLTQLLPELDACRGVDQPKEHNWDVFDHSIQTVATIEQLFNDIIEDKNGLDQIPWTQEIKSHFSQQISSGHLRMTILKIAALLHDLGKPNTKSIVENGRTRFLGHDKEGADIADRLMTRLRFSSKETKVVCNIIEHHMRPTQLSNKWEMPTRHALYRYFRDTGDEAFDILFLNLADHLAARGPLLDPDEWKNHVKLISYVLNKHDQEPNVVKPPKLIDGNDLQKLGYEPGPKIGATLETIREALAAGEISTKDDALDLARSLFN